MANGVFQRVFLGWHSPMLREAARWLHATFGTADEVDLGALIIAVASRRGGRRLLELIVESVGDRRLIPPVIITSGGLPDHLYQATRPVIDDLDATMLRLARLRGAPNTQINCLVGRRPADNDFTRWFDLAGQCTDLNEALSAEALGPINVLELSGNLLPPEAIERWEAITALQDDYENALAQQQQQDRHMARSAALDPNGERFGQPVVLVGTVDLNRITRKLLQARATQVIALVHAPKQMEHGFDELGCLRTNTWSTQPIDLPSESLRVVERWADQPSATLQSLADATKDHALTIDDVTIGLGDAVLEPHLQRCFAHAGIPVHRPTGTMLQATAPCRLLDAAAAYAHEQRLIDLAALLRHPDVERYLETILAETAGPATASTIACLDDYTAKHLQHDSGPPWLGPHRDRLDALQRAAACLVPQKLRTHHVLSDWATLMMEVLDKVYADHPLQGRHAGDYDTMQALESIAATLEKFAAVGRGPEAPVAMSMAEAMAVLHRDLPGTAVPIESDEAAVELLGWLDLHADDAPWLLIAGFNEGKIPSSRGIDPWLPNRLRTALKMPDDRQRLARDNYLLSAKLNSCERVGLVASRHGNDHEPVPPSRLLLTCNTHEMAQRIKSFFKSGQVPPDDTCPPGTGTKRRFQIPPPLASRERINLFLKRVSVTSLSAYVACPYRFYLEHIEKLRPLDVDGRELDSLKFGILLHNMLKAFGDEAALATCTTPEPITQWMQEQLDREAARLFGKTAHAAVTIQLAFARDRLADFAVWQADTAAQGWRIKSTEQRLEMPIGDFANLVGRIDRIDVHPNMGFRLIDYKTGDRGAEPEAHRKGHGESATWVDFQLPCYRRMAEHAKIIDAAKGIQVGYVVLPEERQAVAFKSTNWRDDELDQAVQQAAAVIEKINAGIFWPPAKSAARHSPYARLCGEGVFDLAALQEGSAQHCPREASS